MASAILERPERRSSHSTWAQMSRRERAHAFWLMRLAGWNVDLARAASYDTDSDLVLVEYRPGDPRSAGAFGTVKKDADGTLADIERRFGADERRRAEEVIA